MQRSSGWIAGVNHGAHDASCVLTHEGRLVVWVETERLSRVKHAVDQSPASALDACLKFAGISLGDLDAVGLGSDHTRLLRWLGDDPEKCSQVRAYSTNEWLFSREALERGPPPRVISVSHHRAHAASAFFASGFSDAAALIMDAMGEDTSTSMMSCRGRSIELVKSYGVEHSLGYFYETATAFAGFGANEAGKLMGLAAYGTPAHPLPIGRPTAEDDRIWRIEDAGSMTGRASVRRRRQKLDALFKDAAFPYQSGMRGEPMAYRDFAASVQKSLEDVVLALAQQATAYAGTRRLVMAGGVALNCSATGVLADSGLVDDLFVQPASTDSGVALGAALAASAKLYGDSCKFTTMSHAYWGLAETSDEIGAELERAGLKFEQCNEGKLLERVAETIARGSIVAWHQGRAEVGPRALGARSLLGDPRVRSTVTTMNRVKDREVWRPLAPSVAEESFDAYFEGKPNAFMIVAARVRAEARRAIPAVVHLDGSARPQAVRNADNPRYYRLLREFERRAGVPVLVNTSLNGKGEPICCRARDTIALFIRSDIDLLAIDDFLISKDTHV